MNDIKIYVQAIDHGQGYINYYQQTTISKLENLIKKRGLIKIKIDGYECTLKQLKEYIRELKEEQQCNK